MKNKSNFSVTENVVGFLSNRKMNVERFLHWEEPWVQKGEGEKGEAGDTHTQLSLFLFLSLTHYLSYPLLSLSHFRIQDTQFSRWHSCYSSQLYNFEQSLFTLSHHTHLLKEKERKREREETKNLKTCAERQRENTEFDCSLRKNWYI